MMSNLHLINRVASAWKKTAFETLYARMLTAMSLEQAKEVLGFPPRSAPTPEEISKAYRAKAFENHPDRGGDVTKMVEINTAKDVLQGKSRATWTPDPGPPRDVPRPARPQRPPPPVADEVIEGKDINQAWSANAPPSTVEWKFVSIPEYYWEASYYPGHRVWTFYGQDASRHVFMSIKERGASGSPIPSITDRDKKIEFKEDWEVSWVHAPLSQDITKIAAKFLKSVGTSWTDAKPPPPKKYVAWKGGFKPTKADMQKVPRGGGVALKDILVGTGLVGGDNTSVSGRKSIVEVFVKYNLDKLHRMQAQKGSKLQYGDSYDFFVRVNGKECPLEEDTIENLRKKLFIFSVMKNQISEGKATNLTRLRGSGTFGLGASEAITLLADCLTTEPSWLHLALIKASEEYEVSKNASLFPVVASMTLREASTMTGIPMFELYHELFG